MSFNIDRSSILTFNQKPSSSKADYLLNGAHLEVAQEAKYLGVIIQSDLKFNTHIQNKVSNANRQLDMIK